MNVIHIRLHSVGS